MRILVIDVGGMNVKVLATGLKKRVEMNWAYARLNAMNPKFKTRMHWALTFSHSRAILQPALEIWKGKDANCGVGAESSVESRQMRERCAPWSVQDRDGK